MSGEEGVVYSTTTVYTRDGAYNVCLVDLAGGSRVMSTVTGIAPEDVRIGMAVRARVEPGADRIVFDVI